MKYRIENLIRDKVYITFLSDRKIKIYNPLDLVSKGENKLGQIFRENTINTSSVLKNFSTVELPYRFSLCFYLGGGHKCFTKLQLINLLKGQIVERQVDGKVTLPEDLPFTSLSPGYFLSYGSKVTEEVEHYVKDLVTNSMKYCDLEEIIQDLLDHIYELANNPKYSIYAPSNNLCVAQWMGYFLYRKFNQDT